MSSWHSHPKIYNLGHAALSELLDGHIIVQEKIDGSQFSFGVYDGVLRCRSKGQELDVNAPEKMFEKAVETAKSIQHLLIEGWMYRGEYLQKPKHNTLAYDRTPKGHVILFDICEAEELYKAPVALSLEAHRLGLECVPMLHACPGRELNPDIISDLMNTPSVLGGQKIEGIVIKNYNKYGVDKKVLMGKHVSEAFKEVHKGDWRDRNPSSGDIVALLGEQYRTPARWNKAVQHLRDAGQLEGTPKDIGPLMKEIEVDVKAECEEEIKNLLFQQAWQQIARSIKRGFPEYYKQQLLEKQFVRNKE